MTKVSAATLISAIACSIFTGCTEKDLYNPERGKTELKPESEYFDFATTAQVAFDVNYGKIAGGALIEVFTEDPITYQTNNLYSINGEAVFKIFADADGRFTGNVELPKATGKANSEQIGAEDDAYYINKDGKYPFAIMLPATTGTEGPIRFTPAKETVRIDLEYPDFAKWVESNGATNNDWYLYYQSSKE